MLDSTPTAAPMKNPLAFTDNGVPVFRVRKNDDDPQSALQKYWYSFFADNSQPIDVRTVPSYSEPEYDPSGTVVERSERWNQALTTEAERVIREALQTDLFALPPTDDAPWTCVYCNHQQAAEPPPEGGEQFTIPKHQGKNEGAKPEAKVIDISSLSVQKPAKVEPAPPPAGAESTMAERIAGRLRKL